MKTINNDIAKKLRAMRKQKGMKTINVDINLDLEISEDFYKEWKFDKHKKTFAHATEQREAHLFPEVIHGPESLLHLVATNVFRNNSRRINSVTAREIDSK